jgi:hypothetical protein
MQGVEMRDFGAVWTHAKDGRPEKFSIFPSHRKASFGFQVSLLQAPQLSNLTGNQLNQS